MSPLVTITGADDNVRPGDLAALSERYPFVEWGILLSASRLGTPRYPSTDWVARLAVVRSHGMNLAAHLCGSFAREVMLEGVLENSVEHLGRSGFARVQVNGWINDAAENWLGPREPELPELILQCNDEPRSLERTVARACELKNASVLFDPSGGQGLSVAEWPEAPCERMGYAGGIRPENVETVFRTVMKLCERPWIDMESGVRDERDRFDIGKVESVLETVARCL